MYNLITYSGHTAKETTQLNLLSSGHTAICVQKNLNQEQKEQTSTTT